jgi:hypothetical protein
MFHTIEAVLQHCAQFEDLPAYRLYHGDKATGNLADESAKDATHASSMERLEASLRRMGSGRYCLQLKPSLESSKGLITIQMNLPYNGMPIAPTGAIGAPGQVPGYMPQQAFEQIISAKIGEVTNQFQIQMKDMEIKQIKEAHKREIEEITKKKVKGDDPITALMKSELFQVAGKLLMQKYAGAPAIANTTKIVTDMHPDGPQNETTEQNEEEEATQKLGWALKKLSTVTGSEVATVELICKTAQWMVDNNGSDMQKMLLGQLNSVNPRYHE